MLDSSFSLGYSSGNSNRVSIMRPATTGLQFDYGFTGKYTNPAKGKNVRQQTEPYSRDRSYFPKQLSFKLKETQDVNPLVPVTNGDPENPKPKGPTMPLPPPNGPEINPTRKAKNPSVVPPNTGNSSGGGGGIGAEIIADIRAYREQVTRQIQEVNQRIAALRHVPNTSPDGINQVSSAEIKELTGTIRELVAQRDIKTEDRARASIVEDARSIELRDEMAALRHNVLSTGEMTNAQLNMLLQNQQGTHNALSNIAAQPNVVIQNNQQNIQADNRVVNLQQTQLNDNSINLQQNQFNDNRVVNVQNDYTSNQYSSSPSLNTTNVLINNLNVANLPSNDQILLLEEERDHLASLALEVRTKTGTLVSVHGDITPMDEDRLLTLGEDSSVSVVPFNTAAINPNKSYVGGRQLFIEPPPSRGRGGYKTIDTGDYIASSVNQTTAITVPRKAVKKDLHDYAPPKTPSPPPPHAPKKRRKGKKKSSDEEYIPSSSRG